MPDDPGSAAGRAGPRPRVEAILWDLDGTLAETRRDIATGVNLLLAQRGLPGLSVEQVGRHVGRGSRVLVTRCLQEAGIAEPSPADVEAGYADFLRHYGLHLLDTTHAYPDVPEMLARLHARGMAMAVVSNKPEALCLRLLSGLDLDRYFGAVLGGDSLPQRKPSPEPLLQALERIGAAGRPALMVGDSRIDVVAARAAGLPVAAVTWGFEGAESLRAAEPDMIFDRADLIEAWVLG